MILQLHSHPPKLYGQNGKVPCCSLHASPLALFLLAVIVRHLPAFLTCRLSVKLTPVQLEVVSL